jgi:hypothetical protein
MATASVAAGWLENAGSALPVPALTREPRGFLAASLGLAAAALLLFGGVLI